MVFVNCFNCKKIWDYKGKNLITATCPDCRRLVRIIEVEKEEKNAN